MKAFRSAILFNHTQIKGKIILDVGAGLGIFSLLAARAGASHVYAYEPSELSQYLNQIVQENNLSTEITVLSSPINEVKLPSSVDTIFTSAFGSFFFFDSLYFQFLYARDKFLSEGGSILPRRVSFFVAASSIGPSRSDIAISEDYCLDFSLLREKLSQAPSMVLLDKEDIVTDTTPFLALDLSQASSTAREMEGSFKLVANKKSVIGSLALWFVASFDENSSFRSIETGPYSQPTHWEQILIFTDEFEVEGGSMLDGKIAIKLCSQNCHPLAFSVDLSSNGGAIVHKDVVMQ